MGAHEASRGMEASVVDSEDCLATCHAPQDGISSSTMKVLYVGCLPADVPPDEEEVLTAVG